MKSTLYDLGPMLGVLGVVAWMCWPHLANYGSSSPYTYMSGEKLVRIEKKLLDPQIPSASGRNPFEPVRSPLKEVVAHAALPSTEAGNRKPVTEPEIDWQELIQLLKLNGTSSGGERPCALINGQIYAEGDEVPTPFAEVICQVTRVLEDGVVLEAGDQQVRLSYASGQGVGETATDRPLEP